MTTQRKSIRACFAVFALALALPAFSDSAAKIDREADKALVTFNEEVEGADVFLAQAAGYLVFPKVYKVGVGLGAESGEVALRVGGQTVAYYRTTAGSIGLQLGAQAKSVVIAFMNTWSAFLWPVDVIKYAQPWGAIALGLAFWLFPLYVKPYVEDWLFDGDEDTAEESADER